MAAELRWLDVTVPAGNLRALTWGPDDGPIALCLHGFPDTAYSWRKMAPGLVAAGYRVVAPFMRGYGPSSLPADGSFHIGALMDDALRVRDAVGGSDRDLLIGHDWGAVTATGIAAMADNPFHRIVIMSVPPLAAVRADALRLLPKLPAQVVRSWYFFYFQLPWLPERAARWIVPLLWRKWSPGYAGAEDLRDVDAAIGSPECWAAAIGTYRTNLRFRAAPEQYSDMNRLWTSAARPISPALYLHGVDDGCMTVDFTQSVAKVLPVGSATAVVEHAGHFLQLEQPQRVGELILDFAGAAS